MNDRDELIARLPRHWAGWALRVQVWIAIGMSVASVAALWLAERFPPGKYGTFLVTFLNVDKEQNLPTWYSASMLLVAALLTALVPLVAGAPRRPRAGYWFLLAAALAAMSLDEYAEIHERVSNSLHTAKQLGGVFYFAWIVPGMALVVAFGLAMIPLLRDVPKRTRLLFVAGGVVFVAGAIGMEMIDGAYAARHGETIVYAMLTGIEEALEKLGVAIYLYGLMEYLAASSAAEVPAGADAEPLRASAGGRR